MRLIKLMGFQDWDQQNNYDKINKKLIYKIYYITWYLRT